MSDLLFERLAPASPDLVFGDTGGPVVIPRVDVVVTGSFAPLQVLVEVSVAQLVNVTGTFAAMTVTASAEYRSNTQRPTVGKTETGFQQATITHDGAEHDTQAPTSAPAGWDAFWAKVTGQQAGVEHKLPQVLKKTPVQNAGMFQDASRLLDSTSYVYQEATPVDQSRTGVFEDATRTHSSTFYKHQDGTKRHNSSRTTYQRTTPRPLVRSSDLYQAATAMLRGWDARFQDGVPPPPGITIFVPPPPPGPVPCYDPNPHLVFAAPWLADTHLVFVCDGYTPPPPPPPGDTIVVPVQRVYIVVNSASLRRVSDNALIPTYSLSLSLDASSWTWGFDATIPMEAQSMVEPTTGPVELLATINGTSFRLLAENLARERVFGRATVRVSGRGRNAILDAPYAPSMTFQNTIDRTAQQLAGDVLTINGVPMPWAVEWGLTDWLVPAEVFTHQGTHISALNAIAQAAGGYLQPHRINQTLRILPKYPVAPWNWGSVTPDFELPADVTVRESIQWIDKPEFNRVFVSGQQQGVLGQVTRQGTAGDVVAPMVTDALITHADAARQRGISILADTGRVVTMGLSLPVLQSTGVIEPGKFVRYVDAGIERLGIVRSTSVGVNGGAGSINQELTVESFA